MSSFYSTRANQETYQIALLTSNRLPAYLKLTISEGKLEHAQPLDAYSPVGATEVPLELVEACEDGSSTYKARLDDTMMLLFCINARGQVEHVQVWAAWMDEVVA